MNGDECVHVRRPSEDTWEQVGMLHANHRTDQSSNAVQTHNVTLSECEQVVKRYIEDCRAAGIAIPELPHMSPLG